MFIQTGFQLKLLQSSIAFLMIQSVFIQSAQADDVATNTPTATLDTITITAVKNDKEISTTKTTIEEIKQQQINSQQDLVRYNPEVSVAEVGRYGSKGFAIRGVDGNRVAINVDGLAIPDVEVNDVFAPYGYMNDSRIASELELMSSIKLKTGADGVSSGSGSLGGAISYQTKDPEDLLLGNNIDSPIGIIDIGGYAKVGYTSKNEEAMTAVGLAAVTDKVEALINYAYRDGHELKNYKMRAFDEDRLSINHNFPENEKGTGGVFPDPSHYVSEATLAKLYYKPTDEHKIGIHGSFEERENNNLAITKGTFGSQRRLAWDKNQRESYGLSYEYKPTEGDVLESIEAKYQHQEVLNLGDTFTFYDNFKDENIKDLAFNEYRPIYQDTDQLTVDIKSQPQTFDFMPKATHTVTTKLNYTKQDYDPYMMTKGGMKQKGDGYTYDYEFNTIGSPDMKTDKYSLSVADDMQLTDKALVAVGLRYDNYTRKPYFHPAKAADVEKFSGKTFLTELYNNGDYDNKTTFDNIGWSALAEYNINDQLTAQYKASTGFLVPTVNQMYSSFAILGNYQKPNLDLKPETSLNHELALNGQFDKGAIRLRGFYTKYDDFIDTINYNGETASGTGGNIIEAINIDSAETKGVGIGGNFYLDTFLDLEDTVTLNGQINYATDSTSKGTNLLATQPLTGVFGLDYISADDKYSLHTKLTYIAAKKADDAKKLEYDYTNDSYYTDSFIKTAGIEDKISSVTLLDVYGSVKLREGVSLNAGAYNLLNEEYIPWDNVRQLAGIGINNMIKGNGIERYSAPGVNYAVSLNFEY